MSDIEARMAEWRKTIWGTGPCPDSYQENFRLTDAEREAVEWAVRFAGMADCNGQRLATLRGLLERMGGGVNPAIQPNDAMPMAGSGPTVPANGRASDCSEDERVRASASSIGNTQEVLIGGWRAGKPVPQPTLTDAEREAIAIAVEYVGSAYQVEHHAEVLRALWSG